MTVKKFIKFNNKLKIDGSQYETSVLPDNLNPNDIEYISRDVRQYFLQFNFDHSIQNIHQGFKIHISATIFDYQKILNIIYSLIVKSN